jgi:hypothetical protein
VYRYSPPDWGGALRVQALALRAFGPDLSDSISPSDEF